MSARRGAHLMRIYAAKLRRELAIQFAYRAALAIWLLGLLLQPIVFLVVWTTVAGSRGGTVGGFSASDFAAYFTVLMLVNHLTFTWHFFEFEWRVRQGFFSPLLLLPVHPIHGDLAENLTFKLLTLTGAIPVALVLLAAFRADLSPEPLHVAAFVGALVLAILLRFIVEWTIALLAFWVTRTAAINEAYYFTMLFLSGQIAPLELLPGPVQTIAALLPFRWMVSFPVETLRGALGPDQIAMGMAAQAAWIAVALVVLRFAWRAGIRRYAAVGA